MQQGCKGAWLSLGLTRENGCFVNVWLLLSICTDAIMIRTIPNFMFDSPYATAIYWNNEGMKSIGEVDEFHSRVKWVMQEHIPLNQVGKLQDGCVHQYLTGLLS